MSRSSFLKPARLLHLYLGVFTAPALIFFAVTGGLQTFSLHETTRGRDYTPPKILVQLGQLHKKQTLVVPNKKPQTAAVPEKLRADKSAEPKPAETAPATQRLGEATPIKAKNLLPMKIFFLIVAIGLLISTLTGIYMSYKYVRTKTIITALLVAGIVTPILLTFL
jgi:hypothetical protein